MTTDTRPRGTSQQPAPPVPTRAIVGRFPRGFASVARSWSLVLVSALIVSAAPVPLAAATTPTGSASSDSVAARIDQYVSAQVADSAIPGASVAVIRGDSVMMVRGYGEDSTGEPVTGDSLFRVASLSKSITAMAVMQLVDAGRLDLDDPVHEHLPEFQLDDPRSDRITVRELLDHTSGLTDAMVPELSRTPPRTAEEATTSLRTAHLATPPGTRWSYHNPNYQVAARLVEVVSGEPFDAYLRRHIFEPAGMASSTSTTMDSDLVPGLAEGHVTAYGHAFRAPAFGTFAAGDGGVVSTAADMARWLIVNANGGRAADGTRLVSRQGMRVLHAPSAPKVGYALGWATRGPDDAPTRIDHSGSLFTFTAEEAIWPRSGYGVVLLFNAGSPLLLDQTAIVHGVYDIVEGGTPPAGGPRVTTTRLDTVLAFLTLVALVLGTSGAVRAGRWVRRRRGTPVHGVLGLLPAATVVVLATMFPRMAEAMFGRDLSWRAAAYTWPALVLFVLAALLAAAATLIARTWHWTRARRAGPLSPHQPPISPVSEGDQP